MLPHIFNYKNFVFNKILRKIHKWLKFYIFKEIINQFKMKKLLFGLLAFSCITLYAQKQISMHMYIHVAPEHQAEFEHLEMDYWSKVAKNEIAKGNMTGWGLMKNIGIDANSGSNYLIVNTFKDLEQAFKNQASWDTSFLGVKQSDISTEDLRKVVSIRWYQNEMAINGDNTKFTIFNYARPKNVAAFINENKSLWKNIHQSMQKTTKLDSWGVHTRIHPQGVASKAAIFTRDGFSNLYDAMNYLRYKDNNPYQKMTSKSKMNEILPNGFGYTLIRETLLWVN